MGKIIYNRETGEAFERDHVDAREILASAPDIYTDRDPNVVQAPAAAADPLDHDGDGKKGGSAPTEGLTRAEITADLERMKVDFDPRKSKADLLALRNEARAIRDA